MIQQVIRPFHGPCGIMVAVSDEVAGVIVETKLSASVDGDTIARLLRQLRDERTTQTYLRAAQVCSDRGDRDRMRRALAGAARHLASAVGR